MAELTLTAADFKLTSTWTCHVVYTYDSTGAFNKYTVTRKDINYAENTISFSDECLVGATVNSVRVHADNTTGLAGGTLKINGVNKGSDGFVTLDNVDISDGTINIVFAWNADFDPTENHASYPTYNGSSSQTIDRSHESTSNVTSVYIIVDYEPDYTPPDLLAYTDPNPVQGETYVKAVHMTELHTNVNMIRTARKLLGYNFTSIVAMETNLAGWNNHVLEIRSAIDEMNIDHESWIALAENYPRLDVLLQLRRVVQAVSEGSSTVSANPNVLGDGSTGSSYELSVVNGALTMTEIESSNPPSSSILTDTVTSTAYEFKVIDGALTMTEVESGDSSQFGVFTDTATSTAYKLEVVNGDLTMSET